MQDTINKLKLKGAGIVINAPTNLEKEFVKHGFKTTLDIKSLNSNALVFINNKKEFLNFLREQLKFIEPDSVLWFAYPKGISKIKTDINRDSIRVTAEEFCITTVAAISIDDTWSALRFRPISMIGKK
ncbi:MAG: hypothetical protein HXX16_12470 [Bacteroidales bacterium]|nr:hypothetical protein [Bacteroidales bacterium]